MASQNLFLGAYWKRVLFLLKMFSQEDVRLDLLSATIQSVGKSCLQLTELKVCGGQGREIEKECVRALICFLQIKSCPSTVTYVCPIALK
jgi:hypothetical protein